MKLSASDVAADRPLRRLVVLLGATAAEQGALATARDRVEEARRAGAPAGGQAVPVARQLPADLATFAGRASELARLDALLDHDGRAPAVVISAIAGTAGVGKTALALHWAHRVADRFGDGQLYVNLRGFDPGGSPMAAVEAVRRFLDALDVPPQRIPADPDAQAALYRSLLAGKQMLILLDNAHDPAQIRPLLPGSPGCLVLVTSRNQLSGLVAGDGAHPLTLGPLTPAEAYDLLTRRLGPDRVAAEPEAVEAIITACAWLPLALAIVAARAATQPQLPWPPSPTTCTIARTGWDRRTAIARIVDVRLGHATPPRPGGGRTAGRWRPAGPVRGPRRGRVPRRRRGAGRGR
jgi:NB-ARC domain